MNKVSIPVVLLPGDHFVGDARYRVRTLLGSCVSITLWHPRLLIGAMSHFVLADNPTKSEGELNGRYAADALALMLGELRQLGVRPLECQAKVFGGGAMFDPARCAKLPDVGRRNGEMARQLLQAQGIPIVSESLYDAGHRQIDFSIRSGEVWVRHARPAGSTAEGARP